MQETEANSRLDISPRFVTEFDKMECDESVDRANCDSSLHEQRSEDPVGIEPPEDLLEIIDVDDTIAQDDEREKLGVKPYKCNISSPACATSASITEHLRTHTGKKQFQCSECDHVSSNRSALTAHMRNHSGKKPFQCSVCEYSAAQAGSLRQHLTRRHKIKRPHKCVDCDFWFAKSSTLKKHKKRHARVKLVKRTVCYFATVTSKHLENPNKMQKMGSDGSTDPANCDSSLHEQRSDGPVGEPAADLLEIIDHDDTIAQDDKRMQLVVKPHKCNISSPACVTSVSVTENLRSHTGKMQFQCGECDYFCAQRCALTAHIREHTRRKPVQCPVCEYSAAQAGNLRRHMRQHNINKPYKCVDCDFVCAKYATLQNHVRTHTKAIVCDIATVTSEHLQIPNKTHIKPKPFYICPVCEYSCTKKSILHNHMKRHAKVKLFQCSKCDYSCARRSDLTRHMGVHAGIRPLHCIACDYACTRRFNLQQHMKTHAEETLFKCRLCDYFTTVLEDLEIHTRTHNEQTPFTYQDSCTKWASMLVSMQPQMHTRMHINHFKCKFCAYASTRRGCLKRHMRVHSVEQPFKCTICDYASQYRSSLIQHIRTHSGEKPFKCDVCAYSGTQKANLEVHMLTHAGAKLHKCKLCDYVSSFHNSLRWHEVTHIVAQPFLCNMCNYAAAQRSKLTRHMRSHTGQTPFQCSLCSYAGAQKSYLTRHMRTHSKEKPPKQTILSKLIMISRPSVSTVTSAGDLQLTTAVEEDRNPVQNILKKCNVIVTSIRNNQGNIDYIIEDQPANQVEKEVSMDEMRQTMNQSDGMRDELPKDKEVAENCTEVSQIRNVTEDDIRDIHDTNVVDSRNDVKVDITKVKVEVTTGEIAPTMNQNDELRYEIMNAKEEIKKCKKELILEIRQKMDAFAAVDALQKELDEREILWMEEKRKLEDRINKLENQKTEK